MAPALCDNPLGVKTRWNIWLGKRGEDIAAERLVADGATVLVRNFRSDPGEIDLIVEHEGDLVAVEVKTRTLIDLEKPEEAVTWWKLRRMVRGLETFAIDNNMEERHWRLDVVAIEMDLDGTVTRFDHLKSVYPR